MYNVNKTVHKSTAAVLIAGFLLFMGSALLFPDERIVGWVAGYFVGLLATVLHFVQYLFTKQLQNKRFFSLYTPISLARTLIVLLIFVTLLIWGKFDQLSFTVSFLISYIYHSVINIYLMNKNRQK